jgi:putative endonuclease
MHYLYILYSESSDKYYVGITENIDQRVDEHNSSEHSTYTSKHRPWCLTAAFECASSLGDAMKIERFIKNQKSRRLIETMVSGVPLTGVLAQLVRVPHVRD